VFLRPLANPLSLGFLGTFFATMVLAGIELNWVPVGEFHKLAIGILVFTVPLQLISCVYGFLARDTVCATGMGVQAGMWAVVGLDHLFSKPTSTTSALGLMLVIGAFAAAMPAIGAVSSKMLAAAVMFTTAVRWSITAGYEFTSSSAWRTAGGAAGILLAVLALYASLAFEIEDQRRHTVLPTFRAGLGKKAIDAPMRMQVDQVAHEAGVRKQL
jgi:succinate-acetate transporter protein